MDSIVVIYEDKNFLALYKPAGVLMHSAGMKNNELKIKNRTKELTLIEWVLKKYPEIKNVGDDPKTRPGIVHRLDKDTSGVVLVARNQKYFEYLKALFQNRRIKKIYLTLVWGRLTPKVGMIKKPILVKGGSVKRTIWKGRMEKEAVTGYKVKKYFQSFDKFRIDPERSRMGQDFSLVEVYPKTGRTHQIRVHLASVGHPVVGDALYGPKINPFGLNRQFLHAASLEFNVAQGKRIRIDAELPEELRRIIDDLRYKI